MPFASSAVRCSVEGYLAGAFGRCHDEVQATRRKADKSDVTLTLKGLEAARTQIVNFSATCLMEVTGAAGSIHYDEIIDRFFSTRRQKVGGPLLSYCS